MRMKDKCGIVTAAGSGMGRAGGVRGPCGSPYSPVYSAMKHGVVGFVKALGKRLAKENIRVNAICPGPIDTPMLRVFVGRPDQQSTRGLDKEQLVAQRGGALPMGRPGRPEEIANAALWIHGHMHNSVDVTVGETRVLANPAGYNPAENPDYDPALCIEV